MTTPDTPDHDPPARADRTPMPLRPEAALRRIGEALQDLKYGSVLAIVQDGVVVQVERTEKTRFTR